MPISLSSREATLPKLLTEQGRAHRTWQLEPTQSRRFRQQQRRLGLGLWGCCPGRRLFANQGEVCSYSVPAFMLGLRPAKNSRKPYTDAKTDLLAR